MSDVVSIEEERAAREDTDPRASLIEAQLRAHGTAIEHLTAQVNLLYALNLKIARKLGVDS